MHHPLFVRSPTDWSNLSTALNVTKKMLDCKTKGQKAIDSLDLQLYVKCIQLQKKNKIMEGFIFRMGEPHVAFTVLRVLDKISNNSGLGKISNNSQSLKKPDYMDLHHCVR